MHELAGGVIILADDSLVIRRGDDSLAANVDSPPVFAEEIQLRFLGGSGSE